MNAYARADALDQERQEQMRIDDLRMEAAIDEAFLNAETLAQTLEDWTDGSISLDRFYEATLTLYLDTETLTPSVMKWRGALYALVKTAVGNKWHE